MGCGKGFRSRQTASEPSLSRRRRNQHLLRLAAAIAASCCRKRSILALWRAVTVEATRRAPHSQSGILVFATLPRVIAVADISLATSPMATLSSTQLILSYFAASKDVWKGDAQPPTNTKLPIRSVAIELAFIFYQACLTPNGRREILDPGPPSIPEILPCEPLQYSVLRVIPPNCPRRISREPLRSGEGALLERSGRPGLGLLQRCRPIFSK